MGMYANPKKGNIDIELGFIYGAVYDRISDDKAIIVVKIRKLLKETSFFKNDFISHFV